AFRHVSAALLESRQTSGKQDARRDGRRDVLGTWAGHHRGHPAKGRQSRSAALTGGFVRAVSGAGLLAPPPP
ncbi:MAG: hypothetical protein ACK5YF_03410, partial [Rhodobacterales bacterium]